MAVFVRVPQTLLREPEPPIADLVSPSLLIDPRPKASKPVREPRFYISGLDGLRTVAFLMVFFFHAYSKHAPYAPGPLTWSHALVYAGMNGVPVFFVLSAFLITRLLLIERDRTDRIDLKAYYVRRSLRIWPLYALAVAFTAFEWLRSGGLHGHLGEALALSTFTFNWFRATGHETSWTTGVLWSLSVEEQFYLVWPFVLTYLSRRGIARLSLAMIGVAFLGRIAVALVHHDGDAMWAMSTSHLDSLGLGTLLALNAHRIPRLRPAAWYASFAALLVGMVVQGRCLPVMFTGSPFGIGAAAGFAIVPLLAAGLVALAVGSEGTLLAHPWMAWVGRLTFGMYVVHVIVLELGYAHHVTNPLLLLPVVFGIAYASYHLYEKRFLALKHRFERVQSRPEATRVARPMREAVSVR